MKKIVVFTVLLALVFACSQTGTADKEPKINTTITKSDLKDKIMGGWAGQVIGCTFGGPTEFKFNGTMIQDYTPILWDNEKCIWWYENSPGLYDDVYMDLTFVEVFEKEGLDAPASSHANAFANAGYLLWHANQSARYNILNGIKPPESGHWQSNPHSEDIDFQIEADFAGLMAPGLVNSASEICDKVGHIMNYGDGWYGGVYVAAMYSLAFISNDVQYVVKEALKSIPSESQFYQCISDVIGWSEKYPEDWKQTWFEAERKWSSDVGCPDGVFKPFNIDAKINAAYIVIGLLYGKGDFTETMEISTRCGQDSDCNPASAGGILGTLLGYSNIPEYWKAPVYPVEDVDFEYTTMSLNDVYEIGTKHAMEVLKKNGAGFEGDNISIPVQEIKPVNLEIGFEGLYPVRFIEVGKDLNTELTEYEFEFEGTGFIVAGMSRKANWDFEADHTHLVDVFIDDELFETSKMPTKYIKRKNDICWKYDLVKGKHYVKLVLKNPIDEHIVNVGRVIIYSDQPNEQR